MAARRAPRRKRGRVGFGAGPSAGFAGVVQLGSARPHARALYPGEIERIWRAAPEVWPGERWFVVAIYARYTVGEPGDKFWGSGSIKVLGQSYGRPVGVNFGRRYWGWRGVTVNRRQLVEFPYQIAFGDPSKPPEERQGILQSYGGIRPIHAVSVRPAHLE